MPVSCFGDSYSHTYAAACEILRREEEAQGKILCCASVVETLEKVAEEKCSMGIVPIENSVEGTVATTCDALRALQLYIVREIVLPIRQNLIVKAGVKQEDIRRVYSHPQALAQCRGSLARLLPDAETEGVAYTSAGLDRLDGQSAAIARVPKEGQTVLLSGIEDSPENCTRFLAVRSTPRLAGDKVSVVFTTADKPGALLRVLEKLRERGLNMTKIESRPAKKRLGQYVFYVDFLYDGDNAELQKFFMELTDCAQDFRFLGRYPQYKQ